MVIPLAVYENLLNTSRFHGGLQSLLYRNKLFFFQAAFEVKLTAT